MHILRCQAGRTIDGFLARTKLRPRVAGRLVFVIALPLIATAQIPCMVQTEQKLVRPLSIMHALHISTLSNCA